MIVSRDRSPDHRTRKLAETVTALRTPCVGCKDCRGLCGALIDALILPDLVLSRGTSE